MLLLDVQYNWTMSSGHLQVGHWNDKNRTLFLSRKMYLYISCLIIAFTHNRDFDVHILRLVFGAIS